MSANNNHLSTGLTSIFDFGIKSPKTGTPDTVLYDSSDDTIISSPENTRSPNSRNEMHHLITENYNLKQQLKTINQNYKNIDVPATVIAEEKTGSSLYTLCPFNTHPENTLLYNHKNEPVTLTNANVKLLQSLYVRCPLTTAHPANAIKMNQFGEILTGKNLFPSPNKTRSPKTRKRSPNKTPSPPGNHNKRTKRNSP